MKRVAVIGGGISGLSTCFYLSRIRPAWNVTLYEPNRIGGWLHTLRKDGFTLETGPRSIRVSERSAAVLDIAEEIGVIDKVTLSRTTNKEVEIYADGKLFRLFPKPPFSRLKFLLANPVHLRTALASLPLLMKKRTVGMVDDQSIAELLQGLIGFKTPADAYYVIHTYADAMVQGIYSGDITTLSARSCLPFSAIFGKRNIKVYQAEVVKGRGVETKKILELGRKQGANALSFEGGLSTFVDALRQDLEKHGLTTVTESVKAIRKVSDTAGKVVCEKSEAEYDYVISTIPSPQLPAMLPDFPDLASMAARVKHNSLLALNLGFDQPLPLSGVGYLIPSREKTLVSGVLYDSYQFPGLKPCISVMVPYSTRPSLDEVLPRAISEIQEHTGTTLKPAIVNANFVDNSLPQYEVGHFKIVESVQRQEPAWLRVSGQSLYPSGIPNCVLTAHSMVLSVVEGK